MMSSSCFPILVLTLLLWSISSVTTIAFSNINAAPDHLALLALKAKINDDPLQALSSWNDYVHYCNWTGVTCSRRQHDRVIVLDLQSKKLEGTLSPHIGNLSFILEIRLGMNYFHGPIPQEIGRLSRLEVLSLKHNSFDHEIPTNLTHCSKLLLIDLKFNHLSKGIPVELASLSKLNSLQLRCNEIKGNIPSFLGNLSSLTALGLEENGLTGNIPDDVCRIGNIEHFFVTANNLSGKLPSCLYNLSRIIDFAIGFNRLDGSLPSDIGLTLPNLQNFFVFANKFTGLIPLSFPNASRLKMLRLSINQFTGHVPRNLGMIQGLSELILHSNQLIDDLRFITSLTNCTNLEVLTVGQNSLKGPIPNSIGNLSTKIQALYLQSSQIYGSIPASIGNLVNLLILSISHNNLIGDISKVIGVFPQMVELYLEHNEFSGQIPDSFNHNSTKLTSLFLEGNKLHGQIPPSLGKCQSLMKLSFSYNRLGGIIPKELLHLPSLRIMLNLSNNALSGPLPSEVGSLTNLVILELSGNKLSGSIPTTLSKCLTLEYLSISQNLFTGGIPQSLSTLKGIKQLNFSRNKLSGEIPPYLENFTSLIQLDLSYNDLEGSVPMVGVFVNASAVSLVGNSKLCGGVVELKLPPCQNHKKAGKSQFLKVVMLVIVVSICLVVLLCLIFVWYRKRVSKAKPTSESLFINQFPRITYVELLEATNRFSIDNLIGIGSSGSVYKAILSQEIVAVKVINIQQRGAFKSFLSECNALKNLRHRNLLKIITVCSGIDSQGNDFKALVFEFMPNGSLEEWLHPKRSQQLGLKLNFLQRLNISVDVAFALDYLHNHSQPTIIHCDLKPSNVLLDDDMTARVADFGLAKMFSTNNYKSSQSQGSSIAIKGSIGYVAPEYGVGGEVSMQGDVYSYGIVLLEMFIGKKPIDDMFQNGQDLHSFAKMALPEQVMNIVDAKMLLESTDETISIAEQSNPGTRVRKCLVSVIRLGVACSVESPIDRMNIAEVVTELHHIRDYYQGGAIHL